MANDDEKRKYVPIRQEKPNCFLWFFSPLVYTGRTPCITKECNLPNIHPLDTEGHLRPLLSIGWWFIRLLRRLLLPSIGVVHAAGPAQSSTKKEKECDPCRKLVRACDLPLYVEDGTKKCVDCVDTSAPPPEETIFTETIKCARKEIWFLMEQLKIVQKEVVTSLQSFREQSEDVVSFLREESNFAPRMGAIAVGGLTGYILALRRGIFRKLIYTTVGSTSIAALCYPKEAKAYSQDGFKIVKKYALIGYHFLNGVSRDLTGYQLPPLPNGHLVISDSAHPGPEAVPSSAHILPPTATPTHIPLPHEDPHEVIRNHHHHQRNEEE